MPELRPDLLGTVAVVTAMGLVPFVVATATPFLKVSVVLFILRHGLGLQQTPPAIVLYGLAVVITGYVSAPLLGEIQARLASAGFDVASPGGLARAYEAVAEPMRAFLSSHAGERERDLMVEAAGRVWPDPAAANVGRDDLGVLLPAFVTSELRRAFQVGFLLYLPFVVIDLVVTAVLMAMGMSQVQPNTIAVPLKLFLFVAVEGWSLLVRGIVLGYAA